MTDLNYIVEESTKSPSFEVNLWSIDAPAMIRLWTGKIQSDKRSKEKSLEEVPYSYLMTKKEFTMGMSSGYIIQIDLTNGNSIRYGPRTALTNRGEEYKPKIKHLAFFKGKVYDGSDAGLFETQTSALIDDRRVGSVEVALGRLIMIPHGGNTRRLEGRDYESPRESTTPEGGQITTWAPDLFRFRDDLRESQAGHLVDALSKEVVMKRVHPFDGSGYSPGEHLIAGRKLYMHHGNYPEERITIRALSAGKVLKTTMVPTSSFMTRHEGRVYDLRYGGGAPSQILASDEDYEGKTGSLYDVGEEQSLTSLTSGGEKGLLICLYDKKKGVTKLVSHLKPEEILLQHEGIMTVKGI